MDSQFAFFNRVRFDEKETFDTLALLAHRKRNRQRTRRGWNCEELAIQGSVRNRPTVSPSAQGAVEAIPNLISPHLGNRVQASWTVLSAVFSAQTSDESQRLTSLPRCPSADASRSSRGTITYKCSSPACRHGAESEKMQFEVTPFVSISPQGDHSLAEVPEAYQPVQIQIQNRSRLRKQSPTHGPLSQIIGLASVG